MPDLEQGIVEYRLQEYDAQGVTDQLYDMGKILFSESVERIHYIDEKSAKIAGYAGAIIGLLVSTFSVWRPAVSTWAVFVIGIGSLIGLAGGAIALASSWPRKFDLPSDTDWIEEDGLSDVDRLRRYHVASLHAAISSHDRIGRKKTILLKRSQLCLGITIVSLLLALGNASYRTVRHPSQPASARVASMALGE